MASSSSSHSLLDDLYCVEEEQLWEERATNQSLSLLPILLLQQQTFLEDEDIVSLFSKEQQICNSFSEFLSCSLVMGRRDAVKWMLKVNSYYSFSTITTTLSINYLDNFLFRSTHIHHNNKPWMIHLAAVACLSLAAKVEEIQTPLLLDLQVAGAEYMFEDQSIQKMELLILTTLDWKMHPVTPIFFLDNIIPKLGLKSHLQMEFHRRCEELLLSVVSVSRAMMCYLPSVLATAIMLHVIDQIEPSNPINYHDHLICVLNISKEEVKNCYKILVEEMSRGNKRNRTVNDEIPCSPNGVIDSYYFNSDGSSDSSRSSSLSSSPDQQVMKRNKRVHEQYMPLRIFVDAIGSPKLI